MSQESHRALLEEAGALVSGHFVLASGKHAALYVNKTAGLVLASHALAHAEKIASEAQRLTLRIEAVVGPELGAIALMADVRAALYCLSSVNVAGIMATKIPDTKPQQFEIARDQARFLKKRRTIVAEDILTTGDSAAAAVRAARAAGADVVAVACLWNRGGVTAEDLGVDVLISVIDLQIEAVEADQCPLCRDGVAINTNLGKGAEFLKNRKAA